MAESFMARSPQGGNYGAVMDHKSNGFCNLTA
jgi:hypothetical protein